METLQWIAGASLSTELISAIMINVTVLTGAVAMIVCKKSRSALLFTKFVCNPTSSALGIAARHV